MSENTEKNQNSTEKIIETLHPLERKVLPWLSKTKDLRELAKLAGLKEVEVMRALQWLSNKGIITLKVTQKEEIALDKNGRLYLQKGLPEHRFLEAINEKPLRIEEIAQKAGLEKQEVSVCLGMLKSKAAIEITKDDKGMVASITEQGKKLLSKETLEEKFLRRLSKGSMDVNDLLPEEKFAYEIFRKRKEIVRLAMSKIHLPELTESGNRIIRIKISPATSIEKLTPELIKSKE